MPFGESSRERGNFSLDLYTIRPLADFGARRENDLRGTGYAWTPVLVSFFKLLEVGFFYLGFIPIIKCFTNVSVVWSREGPFDRSQNLGPNL